MFSRNKAEDKKSEPSLTTSLPWNPTVSKAAETIDNEIAGNIRSTPASFGSFPTFKYKKRRDKYQVHSNTPVLDFPVLDKDLRKVDKDWAGFRTYGLPCSVASSMGDSVFKQLRMTSQLLWFALTAFQVAPTQLEAGSVHEEALAKVTRILKSMSITLTDLIDTQLRLRATLVLSERDGFLN